MGPIQRGLLLFNQTLLGRLTLGPLLRLRILVMREFQRVRRGDRSHLPHWGVHVVAVGLLFWFISSGCELAGGQSVQLVAYPGMSLGLLRAFYEHRASVGSAERTASCESNFVFGMLFLYNTLHVVHPRMPAMPWYDIPRYYRENRHELLLGNGQFVFSGYLVLARKYLVWPVFNPVHPTL